MDLFSLGFVLLILVASGVIAWIADGLGKKIGKKRLSLWGLRPKHVASLGTVAMGVFVSALTIGFIAAVSRDAREWLVQGRGLLRQRDELERGNRSLQGENAALERNAVRLRGANKSLEATNLGLERAVRGLQTSLGAERAALQRLRVERLGLVAQRDRLNGQVANLRGGLKATALALAKTQATLAASRTGLVAARANLGSYQASIRQARVVLAKAKRDLATSTANLEIANKKSNDAYIEGLKTWQRNRELESEVAKGEERVAKLTRDQTDAERAYTDAQTRLSLAQAQLDQLADQARELQAIVQNQAEFLNESYKKSRTDAMTFGRGEEVARVVVPGGSDAEVAGAALDSLLRTARVGATSRGAKGHRMGGQTFEAADIVDRKDPKTGAVVDADMLKRSLVAGLVGHKGDQVLVATSTLNAFVGEPVSLDIAVMPNPLIYRRNETVDEAQIDGSLGEDRILAQLSEFVYGRLRQRAIKDRMIPRAGTSAPFGELTDAEVWNLVQNVKHAGRSVRVQAVAENDIRAADPLRLEFRVR